MGISFEWGTPDDGFEVVPRNFNVDEWEVLDSEEIEDIDPEFESTTRGLSLVVGGGGGGAYVVQAESRDELRTFVARILEVIDSVCTECEGTGTAAEDGNPCYTCNGKGTK